MNYRYNVGQMVRVKPLGYFHKLKIEDGLRVTPGGACLMDYHAAAAGEETTITGTEEVFESAFYYLRGHSYLFPEEILDLVETK
jgi:hypothetical protein